MPTPTQIYRSPLSLFTDLYQLTMAAAYFQSGQWKTEAVFHLYFRRHPFGGGFSVACGLAAVVDLLENFRFGEEELAYLADLIGRDGRPLFTPAFLDQLRQMRLACDLDAAPEGTVVFPQEPLVRVSGPLLQAQLLETPLLNLINFQTLIATKAARVCLAAEGTPVVEFGLRRAQGIDGALAASRAAYVGGCSATSNVLAGKLYGLPVRGTHAHSWVMSFASELEAFRAYAAAQPNNCILLVDTYDTVQGVRHAITVGRELREHGHELTGIRLDSGDLAYLSIQARRLLDEAGFAKALIVASNDLDEHVIASLKQQGARVDVWGVGTRLVTGEDDPALGGVYKLAALRARGEPWRYRIKVSEQTLKTTIPGVLQVRRFKEGDKFIGDMIFDEALGAPSSSVMVDPLDPTRRRRFTSSAGAEDLLLPVFRGGRRVREPTSLQEARDRAAAQLAGFHAGIKRLIHPHQYPVGLEIALHERRYELVLAARGHTGRQASPDR